MNKSIVLLSCLILGFNISAQENIQNDSIKKDTIKPLKFRYKQLILPSVLIGYGIIGKILHNKIKKGSTTKI
ncbi:hypothetical protein [Flavobacterium gelatinilyticum]|uniref:hypothetical protein n=1 Tax=Flavobacterium gelatinilyticum TaxID=3003260 RepID=UPI002480E5C7|nr:hypothetical protein [Flavobacterium gelatinilyticum]